MQTRSRSSTSLQVHPMIHIYIHPRKTTISMLLLYSYHTIPRLGPSRITLNKHLQTPVNARGVLIWTLWRRAPESGMTGSSRPAGSGAPAGSRGSPGAPPACYLADGPSYCVLSTACLTQMYPKVKSCSASCATSPVWPQCQSHVQTQPARTLSNHAPL